MRPFRRHRVSQYGVPVRPDSAKDLPYHEDRIAGESALTRVNQFDQVYIGPHREERRIMVRQILRAHRDGAFRWTVMLHRNGYGGPLPTIEPRQNCRLGTVLAEPGSDLLGAELLLARRLRAYETAVIEYDVINSDTGALATGVEREFRVPVASYVIEVCFDPAALPARCLRYSWRERTELITDVRLSPAHSLHAAVVDFGPGTFGLHWEWDG
jgi:hypothetical protein